MGRERTEDMAEAKLEGDRKKDRRHSRDIFTFRANLE